MLIKQLWCHGEKKTLQVKLEKFEYCAKVQLKSWKKSWN